MSMILLLRENSGLRGSNEGKTLLKQLFMLTKWSLMRLCWHLVRELKKSEYWWERVSDLLSIREQRIWFEGREYVMSYNLLLSFCKYRLMGIRPAIASMLSDRDVLKASTIYKVALLWSFSNIFKE